MFIGIIPITSNEYDIPSTGLQFKVKDDVQYVH